MIVTRVCEVCAEVSAAGEWAAVRVRDVYAVAGEAEGLWAGLCGAVLCVWVWDRRPESRYKPSKPPGEAWAAA